MRTHSVLCLCLLQAWPGIASADQAPTRDDRTFRTGVEAVEIDVRVLDEGGQPVTGLDAADFELLEDGVPQDIRIVTPVNVPVVSYAARERAIEPDTRSNRRVSDGHLYVFVLDDLHTHPLRTQRVRLAVEQFLDRHFGPHDIAAIAVTSGRAAATQELTSSRAALNAALEHFLGQKVPSAALERVGEYFRLQQIMEKPEKVSDPREAERAYQARQALESLADVVKWLDTVPARRKAVIFVSEGIDYDIRNLLENRYAGPLFDRARDVIEFATRANATIYPVDPRGLTAIGDDTVTLSSLPDETMKFGTPAFQAELRIAHDGLRTLADETGGFAIVNSNELDAGFERLVRENSHYYILGYQSTNVRRDGKFRRVEVRVDRPGVRVVARRGYYAPKEGGVPARTASKPSDLKALLASPIPVAGLPLESHVAVLHGEGRKAAALVTLEIGLAVSVTPDDGIHRGRIQVSALAVDERGKIADTAQHDVNLKLRPETTEVVRRAGIRTLLRLELEPGRYQLRVAARDATSGEGGSVFHDLVVPAAGKEVLSISPLVVGSRATIVPTTNLVPELTDALPVPPTATRTFDRGDTAVVFAEIYNHYKEGMAPVALLTVLSDSSGRAVQRIEEQIDAFAFEPRRRAYRHRVEIPMKDLAPGEYVLTVTARPRDGADGGKAQRELVFTVRGEGSLAD